MRNAIRGILASLLLLLLLHSRPIWAEESFTGKVVGVTDGDTITVLRNGTQQVKVRLYGVDCPEDGQPFGAAAKQFTSKKVFNLEVTVTVTDTDRYGRAVGDVKTEDGASLTEALVRNGYGWWYHWYARDAKQLGELEIEARARRLGLWAEGNPQPPWAWRHPAPRANAAAVAPAPAPSPAPEARRPRPAPTADAEERIVYGTRTGSKYHAAGCRYLSRSQIPMKLKDAKRIYTPCSVCGGG